MTSEATGQGSAPEEASGRSRRRLRYPRFRRLRFRSPRQRIDESPEVETPTAESAPVESSAEEPPPDSVVLRPRPTRRRPARRPPSPRPDRDGPWLTPTRLMTLVVVLVSAYAAIAVVQALRTVLVMLLVAVFLSFAMEPAVQWLAGHGWRRGPATGAVFIILFLLMAVFFAALATLAIDQARDLIASVPALLEGLAERFDLPRIEEFSESPELMRQTAELQGGFGRRLPEVLLGAAGDVVTIGTTALGILFQLLSIALVTFYLVADGPRARQVLARPLPPDRQREMLAIWELAVAKTGGYIYSRVLLAIVAAVATGGFLLILGVPYPIPLGLVVGVTSVFIPVIGTYLGGILVLIVAFVNQASLGEAPTDVLWVVGFLALYQQLENYYLAPRLQARTMEVHPAVAFVSVLVGGTLLGAVGALLALPATAIIQALLSTYVRRHHLIAELAEVHLPDDARTSTATPPALRLGRARRRKAEA